MPLPRFHPEEYSYLADDHERCLACTHLKSFHGDLDTCIICPCVYGEPLYCTSCQGLIRAFRHEGQRGYHKWCSPATIEESDF